MKSKKSAIEQRVMQQSKPAQNNNLDKQKIIDAVMSSKRMILITVSDENESKELSLGLSDAEKLMLLDFETGYIRQKMQG